VLLPAGVPSIHRSDDSGRYPRDATADGPRVRCRWQGERVAGGGTRFSFTVSETHGGESQIVPPLGSAPTRCRSSRTRSTSVTGFHRGRRRDEAVNERETFARPAGATEGTTRNGGMQRDMDLIRKVLSSLRRSLAPSRGHRDGRGYDDPRCGIICSSRQANSLTSKPELTKTAGSFA